ncbi:hypothetical protein CVT24_000435, partial [Panaeolus cyanescens]
NLLRQGVASFGEIDNWKPIAELIPGRTNKACRKRWLHSLQPNIKKSAWTPQEDKLLLQLYDQLGGKWSVIARHVPGRTDDACAKRYREALDPRLRKDEWTVEEDERLFAAVSRLGSKWCQVGSELGRSGLACRNRMRRLERQQTARAAQVAPTPNLDTNLLLLPEQPTFEYQSPIRIPQNISPEVWPPYFPDEAYPLYSVEEEVVTARVFREPTPHLDNPDPHIAPFQFSSSSLSSALVIPQQTPVLPTFPSSTSTTPELMLQTINSDAEGQSTLSPLSQCNGILGLSDDQFSMIERQPQSTIIHAQSPEILVSNLIHESDNFNNFVSSDYNAFFTASPISFPLRGLDAGSSDSLALWKPRLPNDMEVEDSPFSIFDPLPNEGPPSLVTSPIFDLSALDPNSPNQPNPVDLPNTENPSLDSLLFSPANEAASIKGSIGPRPKKASSRKHKPSIKLTPASRLSSLLPLSTDLNVRPYACGRVGCWDADRGLSAHTFATSGELLDHSKNHPDDGVEKPFRCALSGCNKSWKSINGLQYHLQISPFHFEKALSDAMYTRLSAQGGVETPEQSEMVLPGEEQNSDEERKYVCPHEGCYKAYRQASGLRYHRKHGHPSDGPAQLAIVPPVLERQIPTKVRKLRAKPGSGSAMPVASVS